MRKLNMTVKRDNTVDFSLESSLGTDIQNLNYEIRQLEQIAQLEKMLFLRSQIMNRPQIDLESNKQVPFA